MSVACISSCCSDKLPTDTDADEAWVLLNATPFHADTAHNASCLASFDSPWADQHAPPCTPQHAALECVPQMHAARPTASLRRPAPCNGTRANSLSKQRNGPAHAPAPRLGIPVSAPTACTNRLHLPARRYCEELLRCCAALRGEAGRPLSVGSSTSPPPAHAPAAAAAAAAAAELSSGTQRISGSGRRLSRLHVSSSIDRWLKLLLVMPNSAIMPAPSTSDSPAAALFSDIRDAYSVASTPAARLHARARERGFARMQGRQQACAFEQQTHLPGTAAPTAPASASAAPEHMVISEHRSWQAQHMGRRLPGTTAAHPPTRPLPQQKTA